jgi:hypothetical protein
MWLLSFVIVTTLSDFLLLLRTISKRCFKIQVVFMANAKTRENISVTDVACLGPFIQCSCLFMLLAFSIHPLVNTRDIKQMYPQTRVHLNDSKLLRILRKEYGDQHFRSFGFKTLTFGSKQGDFGASRGLRFFGDIDTFKNLKQSLIKLCVYMGEKTLGYSNLEPL